MINLLIRVLGNKSLNRTNLMSYEDNLVKTQDEGGVRPPEKYQIGTIKKQNSCYYGLYHYHQYGSTGNM